MKTVEQYLASLKSRAVRLFVRGELVTDPIEHPLIAPSVRTVAETYRLAGEPEHRELFTAHSGFIDAPVNRFTHIFEQPEDLTNKVVMQRVSGGSPARASSAASAWMHSTRCTRRRTAPRITHASSSS
jgi:4-hydroxybutyryl-CoA dehydratase / vinylacetyl-CoA-Delta-isomerase